MPKENPVDCFLNKMADLILLNLIFLLCCIPVVTIGPAITALYAVSLRSVRYGDGYVIQTFFRSFKQNFKQSFVAGMIGLLFVCLLVIDLFLAQCGTCFHVRIYDSGECMRRLFGFYCVLMAVSGDCKTGKSFACADKKCSRHGGCPFFPIYAVCKCDSTGGRLYGIYQYHYGCAAAYLDRICFTCICMFILFL